MKKKITSQVVTKSYLRSEFKTFEKRIGGIVGDRLVKSFDAFRKEIAFAFDTQEEKLTRKMMELHDQTQTKLDGLVKDIEDLKIDKDLGVDQTRRLRIQVDNHEKRLTKLEQAN